MALRDFSTEQITSTSAMEYLAGYTVDTILNYSPIVLFFLGNQKKWRGTNFKLPIKHSVSSEGKSFSGLEKFSTNQPDRYVNLTFQPTGREEPISVSQIEIDISETNNIIPVLDREMKFAAQDMASRIADLFYTLQTGQNFQGLIDIVDDGTNLGSYGGQSRTTYAGLKAGYTASIGNITAATMATSYIAAVHGRESPNLLVCDKTTWTYVERLVQAGTQGQYNATAQTGYPFFTGAGKNGLPNLTAPGQRMAGNLGFQALTFKSIPVVADEACPTGNIFMLNTNSIAFYGVKSTAPEVTPINFYSDNIDSVYNVPVTTGFGLKKLVMPEDQYSRSGHILLVGNLIGENPRLNARLLGITGA